MFHAKWLLVLPLLSFACGDAKEDSSASEEDPGEHACEQRALAGTTLSLVASRDDDASTLLMESEEPWTLNLVPGASGFARIEVEQAESMLLFMGIGDVLNGLWLGEAEQALPEPSPEEACPSDIPEHFHLDLATPGTWHIELGPAAVDSAWLMLLDASGHTHE